MVTGAAGFIGSHLCERLIEQGFQVIGIDNFDPFYDKAYKQRNLSQLKNKSSFQFIEGDAANADLLSQVTRIDVVVHLAARAGVLPSLKSPQKYIDANIRLTNSLLEWIREKGISKLIFGSSSSVYGNTTDVPFKEDQDVNHPISPYAFTKRSCELMNYTYHKLYNIDIINLRFFTVYGERQRPDLAIHKFVRSIINREPIHLFGNGDTARDYTYCADSVTGIMAAINYIGSREGVWETINIGNQNPVSLKELVNTIAGVLNIKPVIVYEDLKAGDVDITYASIEKARKLIGYNPMISLKEGVENFVRWYKENHTELK
jgi:nucleoside-diphosphate-sugar epimerase